MRTSANKRAVRDLHHRAIAAVDAAELAKRAGDEEGVSASMAEALELERHAAEITPLGVEPDRSWLYEGAATLALECGDGPEAARLAAAGLAGRPANDVRAELERLVEAANAKKMRRRQNERRTALG